MSIPPDRCPGVFRTHPAADGALARVRLPGGVVSAAALEALALAAEEFGDGGLDITVRGSLQVRGIADEHIDAFGAAVTAAGLASDSDHDRVRNLTVSPFTGRVGGRADLHEVASDLQQQLAAASWAAALSGRFWFGLDDGRGDVLSRSPDITGVAHDNSTAIIVVGDCQVRTPIALDQLASAMLTVAQHFLGVAAGAWRVTDLDTDQRAELMSRINARALDVDLPQARHPQARVGWFTQTDGRVLLGATVPFGRLSAEQAKYAAAIGVPITVTTEREILFPDLDEAVADTVVRVLAPLGFIFDARSPWLTHTACTGLPGCAKSSADVRSDLLAHLADHDPDGLPADREHWIGCERGCGSPAQTHIRVLARGDSYLRTPHG